MQIFKMKNSVTKQRKINDNEISTYILNKRLACSDNSRQKCSSFK